MTWNGIQDICHIFTLIWILSHMCFYIIQDVTFSFFFFETLQGSFVALIIVSLFGLCRWDYDLIFVLIPIFFDLSKLFELSIILSLMTSFGINELWSSEFLVLRRKDAQNFDSVINFFQIVQKVIQEMESNCFRFNQLQEITHVPTIKAKLTSSFLHDLHFFDVVLGWLKLLCQHLMLLGVNVIDIGWYFDFNRWEIWLERWEILKIWRVFESLFLSILVFHGIGKFCFHLFFIFIRKDCNNFSLLRIFHVPSIAIGKEIQEMNLGSFTIQCFQNLNNVVLIEGIFSSSLIHNFTFS